MFRGFESTFTIDASISRPIEASLSYADLAPKDAFIQRFNGSSFNSGLYRVVSTYATQGQAQAFIEEGFPDFAGRMEAISYDWLGRVFALDSGRLEEGLPAIMMFEPGTGEALEIPCNIVSFHESELVQYGNEALAQGFHEEWLASGGPKPALLQCIGYKNPLFLGGSDTLSNIELADLDVYWTLMGQLVRQTRHLPSGTKVSPRVG